MKYNSFNPTNDPGLDHMNDEWDVLGNDGDDPELMEAYAHALAKEDPPRLSPFKTLEEEDMEALREYGEGIKEEQEYNKLVADEFFRNWGKDK